jgi:hypothetical protein
MLALGRVPVGFGFSIVELGTFLLGRSALEVGRSSTVRGASLC